MLIKFKGAKLARLYDNESDGIILEFPGFVSEYFRSDNLRFETESGETRELTKLELRDYESALDEFSENVTARKLAKLIELRG